MGATMIAFFERRDATGAWTPVECNPRFDSWSGLYGWIADVRNSSEIGPLVPRRGMPVDATEGTRKAFEEYSDLYGVTWYQLTELTGADYTETVFDRGEKRTLSLRDFLGESYFGSLEELEEAGVERIIFAFDG